MLRKFKLNLKYKLTHNNNSKLILKPEKDLQYQ